MGLAASPWEPPQSRLASQHLPSCAWEQPLGRCLGSPRRRCSCFCPGAAGQGLRGAGGLLQRSPGGLDPLPGKAAVSRYLPPSSGPSAKCGRRRRRMRWLILIVGQIWTRGLWGCSELGLEVRDCCLHPAPAPAPQPKSGAAKYGEEKGFIAGCQPPATSPRHHGGYPGAEQGSGAPSTAELMGCESFHAAGSPGRRGVALGTHVTSISAWSGREAPGFREGERHGGTDMALRAGDSRAQRHNEGGRSLGEGGHLAAPGRCQDSSSAADGLQP